MIPRGLSRQWRLAAGAFTALLAASAVAAQTPRPPKAADFAMAAAQSDEYEIEAARDAAAQTRNAQLRAFAERMIDDHMRLSDSLRRAAIASGLTPPPPAMSSDQASMLTALQGLRGDDFDKAYVRQQVLSHQQALAVERSYADAGDSPDLRRVAQSDVPVIQHHLEMALQISSALGAN